MLTLREFKEGSFFTTFACLGFALSDHLHGRIDFARHTLSLSLISFLAYVVCEVLEKLDSGNPNRPLAM